MPKITFKIACTWEVYGVAEVEANSLDEAIELVQADDFPLPSEFDYVDGSFQTDYDMSELLSCDGATKIVIKRNKPIK
jgi:hypothetical protein